VTLRARLLGLVLVLVVLLGGTAAVVSTTLARVDRERTLLAERLQPASVQIRGLMVALVNQQTAQRGFVLTGEEAFLAPYQSGRHRAARTLQQLHGEFAAQPGFDAALDRVAASVHTWQSQGAQPLIDARRAGETRRVQALLAQGTAQATFEEVRRRTEELRRLVDARADRAQQRALTDSRRLRAVVVTSAALLVALALASGLLLQRWFLRPVMVLRASMREVAGGRLDTRVDISGPPEVAAIGADAESMRRRIVSELEAARAATEALGQHSPVVAGLRRELASEQAPQLPGIRVFGMLQSAEGVLAGDWWEAVRRPDGTFALLLADVSGHGAPAGLVAVRFKQRITALLGTALDPLDAFEVAARDLDEDPERFVACLLITVDPLTGALAWVNAGHPAALLVSRAGQGLRVRELGPTGPLVSGVTGGWALERVELGEGDLVLACTDGVLEARSHDGREFGTDGVVAVLRALTGLTPELAVTEVVEAVRGFCHDLHRDDVTCVGMSRDRDARSRPPG
jgi:sigma-B regulation protein RsbU (phosphoserine phosphatase)